MATTQWSNETNANPGYIKERAAEHSMDFFSLQALGYQKWTAQGNGARAVEITFITAITGYEISPAYSTLILKEKR